MSHALFIIYRYGPLGVADVRYVKLRKDHRTDWITDRSKASVFKRNRAEAYVRGYREMKGEDLVIEPVASGSWPLAAAILPP